MTTDQMPTFSILIPSWNNLAYLRLCVESIRHNSAVKHQILVYANEGRDGTLQWLQEQDDIEWLSSAENQGICLALNALRPLAKSDYLVFANDDMYLLPGWDTAYWQEICKHADDMWHLSSMLIEPQAGDRPATIAGRDYGRSPADFDHKRLLSEYSKLDADDQMGAMQPLNIVSTRLWDLVGGYSIEYSPGMCSDPDFVTKLYMAGVRYFRVLSASRVYHFQSVSTDRVRKNKGSLQYLYKWGIRASLFLRTVLHRGHRWDDALVDSCDLAQLRSDMRSSWLKAWLKLGKHLRRVSRLIWP